MTAATLFDWKPSVHSMNRVPAQNHSSTSIAAAEAIYPKIGTLELRVLQYLRGYPDGLTDEQMQTDLGMNPSTQRPRRRNLQLAGLVKDSGMTRKTESGRQAVIWQAT